MQCKPSGLPRQGVPYPMQIVQTDEQVIFLYEGGLHTFRIVPNGWAQAQSGCVDVDGRFRWATTRVRN
jgi:hypothetical protein